MKYIKLFDTTADMNAAIANSTIGFLGMAENNGNPVIRKVPEPAPTPSHDYVEIGGVKWATMNVGAESITDTGLYFQWGDTQGYTASQVGEGEGKKYFYWGDYKYNSSTDEGIVLSKYNSTDSKTVLESSDDAVNAAWGGNWRMPTTAEYQALGEAVNAVWTTNYNNSGVNGIVCTDKTDSSKVLFFPAAGYCKYGEVNYVGEGGDYWSSSLSTIEDEYYDGCSLYFAIDDGEFEMDWGADDEAHRLCGYPVRGILDD